MIAGGVGTLRYAEPPLSHLLSLLIVTISYEHQKMDEPAIL